MYTAHICAHRYIHIAPPQDGVQGSEEEIGCLFSKGERETSVHKLLFAASLVFVPKYQLKLWLVLTTLEGHPLVTGAVGASESEPQPCCGTSWASAQQWISQHGASLADLLALSSGTSCFWILSMTHRSLKMPTQTHFLPQSTMLLPQLSGPDTAAPWQMGPGASRFLLCWWQFLCGLHC